MNYIVTTTINSPTKALELYAGMPDWKLIVVGDLKTPHSEYKDFDYLSPEKQENDFGVLSDKIGWNCIQRRNLGIIEAYKRGAEIIALVDDDNIPYKQWGSNLTIGREIDADYYETDNKVFDPLSVTNNKHLWHRGFPVQLLKNRLNVKYVGERKITPLIQADLWNGDPDVDAIGRIVYNPSVYFDVKRPYFANKPGPFNSQNTFFSREVFPDYFLFPHVGRMDDIWASYVCKKYPMVYAPASVFQDRNKHNIVSDLKAEMLGYEHNLDFIDGDYRDYIDDNIYQIYRSYFK